MNKRRSIGFYSRWIAFLFYSLCFVILAIYTFLKVDQFDKNYKHATKSHLNLFKNEWRYKFSSIAYVMENDILPAISKSLQDTNIAEQNELLSSCKKRLGYNPLIQDLVILDREHNIRATSNAKNIRLEFKDVSLLDKIKSSPLEVQYGEPLINKDGRGYLLTGIGIGGEEHLQGYLMINIDLENFAEEFALTKQSTSLEKISFFEPQIYDNKKIISQSEILKGGVFSTVKLLLNSYRSPFVVMKIDRNEYGRPATFFTYNMYKQSKNFFIEYISSVGAVSFVMFIFYLIFRSYIIYIIDPISKYKHKLLDLQNKHEIFSEIELQSLRDAARSEMEDFKKINKLSDMIANKLHYADAAVKLVQEYNKLAMEDLQIKSAQINDSIDDLIQDYKKNTEHAASDDLISQMNDIYCIGLSKIKIIDSYKNLISKIMPVIVEGRKKINLLDSLNEITQQSSMTKPKTIITKDNEVKTYSLELYKMPLYNALELVLKYLSKSYPKDYDKVEISLDEVFARGAAINFKITFKQSDYNIHKDYSIESLLEEARIYSLFNCAIITEEFDVNFYKLTMYLGNGSKNNSKNIEAIARKDN